MKSGHKKIYILVLSSAAIIAAVAWLGYSVGYNNGSKAGIQEGSKNAYDYAECLFRNHGSEALSDPPKCSDSKGVHVWPKAP